MTATSPPLDPLYSQRLSLDSPSEHASSTLQQRQSDTTLLSNTPNTSNCNINHHHNSSNSSNSSERIRWHSLRGFSVVGLPSFRCELRLIRLVFSEGGGVRHGFTAEFVVDGTCGYCRGSSSSRRVAGVRTDARCDSEQFNGAYNLQHHLRFAQHHYHLCCDKFFVSAQAMDQHMRDTRGDHQYFSSED